MFEWFKIEAESEGRNTSEIEETFRPPTGSLRVGVCVKGRTRTLLLYLAYAAGEHSETTDRDELLNKVVETLEGRKYRSVKTAIVELGRIMMDRFPRVCEVEVNAVRERFFERRTDSGMIFSATFHR